MVVASIISSRVKMTRLDQSYGEERQNRASDSAYHTGEVALEVTVDDASNDEGVDLTWQHGGRIVELGVLSDQLSACKQCCMPLNFQNCVGEKRYGLGSILYVVCSNYVCNHNNMLVLGQKTFSEDHKNMVCRVGM